MKKAEGLSCWVWERILRPGFDQCHTSATLRRETLPFALYQFGDFSLHCGKFELCRNGRRLKLERKPLELLVLLVTKHGQVATLDEIAGCLWEREVFVDIEHGINTAIRKIRQILGDSSDLPQFVLTISGSGYRFIAPVTAAEPAVTEPTQPSADVVDLPVAPPEISSTTAIIPSAPRPDHRLWLVTGLCVSVLAAISILTLGSHPLATHMLHRNTRPAMTSLAVIPLDNLSGDQSHEYFADGMTDELTTMLAKDSTLRIVSRNLCQANQGCAPSLPEIARDLHVDGILEGSVSRAIGQVHMTLQLIRADTDQHIWAESYDRYNNDVPSLPDQVARTIAKHLGSAVASSPTRATLIRRRTMPTFTAFTSGTTHRIRRPGNISAKQSNCNQTTRGAGPEWRHILKLA